MAISLKAHRVNTGLSAEKVSKEIGVSAKTIYDWEKDYTKVPLGKLMKLCKLYGISIDDIG